MINAAGITTFCVLGFLLHKLTNRGFDSKKCLFCNEDARRWRKHRKQYKYCSDKCHKAMRAKKASDREKNNKRDSEKSKVKDDGEKNNKRDSEKSKDKDDGILTRWLKKLTEVLFVLFIFIGMIYVIFFLPGGKIYVH